MATTRGRQVFSNQTVLDQADFFQGDGFTRVTGITLSDVTAQLFLNNALQSWPLVNGSVVTDVNVAAGSIYFYEVSSGIYSVRFRPNAIGYWRMLINYPAGSQILAQDYDVVAQTGTIGGGTGIKSSFIKPGDRT